jgi:hypothetical protein
MSWKADLALGQKYEKIALEKLGEGDVVLPPENVAHSPWDFKHAGRAYEVKSDRWTARTGNLCIEYEHTGVPSGISLTEADDWIYYAISGSGDYAYKIPVGLLREAVARPGVRKHFTDGGNSRFFLIPERDFVAYRWN